MKQVTIKDIARVAGVSYSTVSRSLTGSPEISAETRDRILKLCREMNYTANTVARSMVMRSTKLLGLIVTDISNPFMSELAYYIDGQARTRGYSIILCNSLRQRDQERSLFELMISRKADGVILVPADSDSYHGLEALLPRMPTVFLGENLRDAPASFVTVDNYRGAYMGTDYLYRLGHRRILYFGRRKGSTTHQLRSEGYRAACADYGLEPHYLNNAFSSTSIKNGYQLAKQLFSQPLRETAIFAATDTNALGILQAAEENGIRIPDDLSLLGFDNIRDSGLPRIGLTTVEQPKKLLASMAVDSLLDKIENEQAGYTHRILSPGLVERSTCRAVTDGSSAP